MASLPTGEGADVMVLVDTRQAPRSPARPQLKAVTARVAASLATAVVAPAVLFALTLVTLGVDEAVIVALVWMAAAMCWRWASGRPVSWLLVLTLGIMTVKTGFTLATGNTFVYFVQPVFTDAVVATVFLGRCAPPIRSSPASLPTSIRWTGHLPHDPGYGGCSDDSRSCGAWSSWSREV